MSADLSWYLNFAYLRPEAWKFRMSEMSEIQKELEAKVFLPTTVGDSEVIDIHSPTVPLFLIPNAKGG